MLMQQTEEAIQDDDRDVENIVPTDSYFCSLDIIRHTRAQSSYSQQVIFFYSVYTVGYAQ